MSVIGDVELDESTVWEAIAEPIMSRVSDVVWVVNLNRQRLSRVISGIRTRCWREMFASNGWAVINARYGRRLREVFHELNGELLRNSIDEMSNDSYQCLLPVTPSDQRDGLS